MLSVLEETALTDIVGIDKLSAKCSHSYKKGGKKIFE